jgi:hypothetical protein
MKTNTSAYFEKYNQVKVKPEYAFSLAQEFVSEILSLPPQERFALLPLLKQIEEDAFDNGIEISNLNYSSLENEKKIWDESQKAFPNKKKEKKEITESDFNKVLTHFFTKYELIFGRIKGYFLFRLENIENSNTKVRILFDEEFNKHPEINSFDLEETEYDLKKIQLTEFVNSASKEIEIKNQNYLCVLLITSHLRENEAIIKEVKNLTKMFSNCDYISIKKKPVSSFRDFDYKPIEEGLNRIEIYSSTVFNNRELTFEEEAIIKRLFPGKEMILDYKILKGGNSGSKVIEIQPSKVNSPTMLRSVAKVSQIDKERKIQIESDRFNEYITLSAVNNYSSNYYYTETHEAIRYNYASSDSKKDSFSFSKLISDQVKNKYGYPFTLKEVIDQLFESDPYKVWDGGKYPVTEFVKNLYGEYLQSEEKILKSISLINGIDEEKVNDVELVKNFNIIKEHSLSTTKKTCHGDLHSENFFKDDKGVYLIDFGWTNKHHSLIDYTTLECSLKFKHLPYYIPVDDLIKYEAELLLIDSFSNNFDLSFINRKTAFDIFKLITQIREKAKEHMTDKTNSLEYLISLFIINFRQIQYADLNQMYAMRSAEVLSRKIISLI